MSEPSSPSSTPHSISRPRTNSSTMILRSCRNASAIALANSCSVPALLMPTDEPSRAGLTNTGRPSSATTASKAGASPWAKLKKRAIGSPRARSRRLATSLFIAGTDIGHARNSRDALDCSLLAEGAMQNREDDVDGPRQVVRPTRLRKDGEPPDAARNKGDARSALGNSDRKRAALERAQEPGAGPSYADRNRLVARRVERPEHVAGGHDGHVVLGRAAAEQQCDAQSFGHAWSPESACWQATSPKGGGLVNRRGGSASAPSNA